MNRKGLNRQGHLVMTLFTAFLVWYVLSDFMDIPSKYLIYIPPLLFGGIFPDIIEGATSPTHRKFFHSKRALRIVVFAIIPLTIISSYLVSQEKYLLLTAFFCGYALHLCLDSLTPAGLPP